jgi:hypothetical protein
VARSIRGQRSAGIGLSPLFHWPTAAEEISKSFAKALADPTTWIARSIGVMLVLMTTLKHGFNFV